MLKSGNVVSLKFWRMDDAEIITAENVICTSGFHHRNTFNLKFLDSGQFRKVRVITIFEINDMEVFI